MHRLLALDIGVDVTIISRPAALVLPSAFMADNDTKAQGGNEQQQQPILNLNHQGRRAIIPVHTPGVGEEEEEEEVCDA
jgi:hypothetical protein